MAYNLTIKERLQGLIGSSNLTTTDSNLNEQIQEGAIEVMQRIIDIDPTEVGSFTERTADIVNNEGVEIGLGVKSVFRANGSGAIYTACDKVDERQFVMAEDSSSLHYRSKYNPVYTIRSGKLFITPPPADNSGKDTAYAYIVSGIIKDDVSGLAVNVDTKEVRNFPKEYIRGILLYCGIRAIAFTDVNLAVPTTPTLNSSVIALPAPPSYAKPTSADNGLYAYANKIKDFFAYSGEFTGNGTDLIISAVPPVAPDVPGAAPTVNIPSMFSNVTFSDPSMTDQILGSDELSSISTVSAEVYAGIEMPADPQFIEPPLPSFEAFSFEPLLDMTALSDSVVLFEESADYAKCITQLQALMIDIGSGGGAEDASGDTTNLKSVQEWLIDEDMEMAQATLQEVSALLQNAQIELAKVTQANTVDIQRYSHLLSKYQADLNTSYTIWQAKQERTLESHKSQLQMATKKYEAELAAFNQTVQARTADATADVSVLQAQLQADVDKRSKDFEKDVQQAQLNLQRDMKVADLGAQKDIHLNQARLNKETAEKQLQFQKETEEYKANLETYRMEIEKYNSDLRNYQGKLSQYQTDLGVYTANQQKELSRYQALVSTDIQAYNAEMDTTLKVYAAAQQDQAASYQASLAEYQAEVQAAITRPDIVDKEDIRSLQKFQADIAKFKEDKAKLSILYQQLSLEYDKFFANIAGIDRKMAQPQHDQQRAAVEHARSHR